MTGQHELPEHPVVAVVGSTGAVGTNIIEILEERDFPFEDLVPVASERSAGKKQSVRGEQKTIQTPDQVDWASVDLALVSAGSDLSKQLAPQLVEQNVVVVDNSSTFRMNENTPLVVPEVNWSESVRNANPIANPNCSASQLVMALKPLQDEFGLNRVFVSTYQSVSGAGGRALEEFEEQREQNMWDNASDFEPTSEFRDPIDQNVLPFISHSGDAEVSFGEGTGEENKVVAETRKILGDPDLDISVTCARIPVPICHAEAVHVDLDTSSFDLSEVLDAFDEFPGVIAVEDGQSADYPQPVEVAGQDPVHVGRVRTDEAMEGGLAFWCVGDNLRKGAALNTVQIAEKFLP